MPLSLFRFKRLLSSVWKNRRCEYNIRRIVMEVKQEDKRTVVDFVEDLVTDGRPEKDMELR
jgi:hypothetical protein